MLVRLTPEGERLVARDVAAGQYSSPEEAVETALRLAEAYRNGELDNIDPELDEIVARLAPTDRDGWTDAEKLDALRREVQRGLDSGVAGPFDVEEIARLGRGLLNGQSRADIRG